MPFTLESVKVSVVAGAQCHGCSTHTPLQKTRPKKWGFTSGYLQTDCGVYPYHRGFLWRNARIPVNYYSINYQKVYPLDIDRSEKGDNCCLFEAWTLIVKQCTWYSNLQMHCSERIDGDRHSQKVANRIRGQDKRRLMGVASHLLSRWYIHIIIYKLYYKLCKLLVVQVICWAPPFFTVKVDSVNVFSNGFPSYKGKVDYLSLQRFGSSPKVSSFPAENNQGFDHCSKVCNKPMVVQYIYIYIHIHRTPLLYCFLGGVYATDPIFYGNQK